MNTYILRLPFDRPLMTLNSQRRMHWSQQAKEKERVTSTVAWLAKNEKIPALETVRVCLTWYPKDNHRRDVDGLAPLLKGCLDGLVLAGVLKDDSHRYVPFVSMGLIPDPSDPHMELRIVEVAL